MGTAVMKLPMGMDHEFFQSGQVLVCRIVLTGSQNLSQLSLPVALSKSGNGLNKPRTRRPRPGLGPGKGSVLVNVRAENDREQAIKAPGDEMVLEAVSVKIRFRTVED